MELRHVFLVLGLIIAILFLGALITCRNQGFPV